MTLTERDTAVATNRSSWCVGPDHPAEAAMARPELATTLFGEE